MAVRELCEFTAKQGDLDRRFTPAPTSQEGIAGHGIVAGRRGRTYQREIRLTGRHQNLLLSGRADGFDAERNELEEIKTYRGDLRRMPDNHRALHWAQLKIYGALLCAEKNLPTLTLTLVYFEVDREEETPFSEHYTRETLQTFFTDHCERFLAWAEAQLAHRQARDAALETMAFPFPDFHAGQRQLAEAVFRAARDARDLMAQAPTGIGKSIGTLFPALKAMGHGHLDKVFFLTVGNPKAIAFFAALLPTVVDLHHVNLAGYAQLASVTLVLLPAITLVYAALASRVRGLMSSAKAQKRINRTAAVVMAGAGLGVAVS